MLNLFSRTYKKGPLGMYDLCFSAGFYQLCHPSKFFLDLSNLVSKLLLNVFHDTNLPYFLTLENEFGMSISLDVLYDVCIRDTKNMK